MKIVFNKAPFSLHLVCFSLLWASCNIINPPEPVPAYLQIDSAKLKTDYSTQGSASQKITDAWVLINDNAESVYEVPKRFPLLGGNETKLIISAGILDNGSSSTHVKYPFYYPDTLTLNLQSKAIYNINPVFHYRTPTKFPLIEDFESSAGFAFIKLSGDTNMKKISDPSRAFEGSGFGLIYTDATHPNYEGVTSDFYPVKNDGSPVYIEMNYKCNMAFQVGVNVNNSSGSNSFYEWIINPKYTWNKIYLNVTDVAKLLGGGDYKILFRAQLPAGSSEGDIYLDNIKLVTL